MPGRGAYFSFRLKEYVPDEFADLKFENEKLFSAGMLNQGFLVELGNVNIENVNLSTEALNFLVNFVPATKKDEFDKQTRQFSEGIKAGEYTYKNNLAVKADTVYAFRSAAYRGKLSKEIFPSFGSESYAFVKGDNRKDVIVVFRVLAKEPDGSITLIWKILQSKKSPKLDL